LPNHKTASDPFCPKPTTGISHEPSKRIVISPVVGAQSAEYRRSFIAFSSLPFPFGMVLIHETANDPLSAIAHAAKRLSAVDA
jgi:hypothetical protein